MPTKFMSDSLMAFNVTRRRLLAELDDDYKHRTSRVIEVQAKLAKLDSEERELRDRWLSAYREARLHVNREMALQDADAVVQGLPAMSEE